MGDTSDSMFSKNELESTEATLEQNITDEEAQIQADQNRIFEEQEKRFEAENEKALFNFFNAFGADLDETKLNNIISQSSETITNLNSQIQSIQQKENRDQAELDALLNYRNASDIHETSASNYKKAKLEWYIASPDGCNNPENNNVACSSLIEFIRTPLKQQGEKIKNINNIRISELITDTLSSVKSLNDTVIVVERLEELYQVRKMEYDQLKNAINNQQYSTWTSERKVIYEDWAIEHINYIKFIITGVYYLLFIVYLFVGDYFAKKRYKTLLGWVLILVYLGIPLIMNKFVTILFYIGYQIKYFASTRMPKDVYVNL